AAGEVLQDDERGAGVFARVDHLDDVGVDQADQGADFAGEAGTELRVVNGRNAGRLDHNFPVEVAVAGAIDEGHAALTQRGRDLIAAPVPREPDPAGAADRHGVSLVTLRPEGDDLGPVPFRVTPVAARSRTNSFADRYPPTGVALPASAIPPQS